MRWFFLFTFLNNISLFQLPNRCHLNKKRKKREEKKKTLNHGEHERKKVSEWDSRREKISLRWKIECEIKRVNLCACVCHTLCRNLSFNSRIVEINLLTNNTTNINNTQTNINKYMKNRRDSSKKKQIDKQNFFRILKNYLLQNNKTIVISLSLFIDYRHARPSSKTKRTLANTHTTTTAKTTTLAKLRIVFTFALALSLSPSVLLTCVLDEILWLEKFCSEWTRLSFLFFLFIYLFYCHFS